MKKKNLVDAIKVASPCTEDWDEMTGNKKVRFCSHCDLNVNNLSEMSRRETMRLVKKSGGKLCVRYIEHPVTKVPVFADRLYQIGRRAGIAAGVLGASLAVSTVSYAQGGVSLTTQNLDGKTQKVSVAGDKKADPKTDKTASIFGTITDLNGAIIPAVEVTLINKEDNQKVVIRSNDKGFYEFKNIFPAIYNVEFNASSFVTYKINDVKINSQNSAKIDATLQVDNEVFLMGAVAVSIVRTPFESAILDGNVKLVQDFISKGANINEKDKNGDDSTPLHLAVEKGNLNVVQILLNSGAKVNVKDLYGNTPLMEMNEDTSPEVIRLLIRYGAKLDERNESGATALMRAADEENFGAVKVLLEAGADANLKDNDDDAALDLTADEKIESLLISYGATVKDK